jgi:hypothetical protein
MATSWTLACQPWSWWPNILRFPWCPTHEHFLRFGFSQGPIPATCHKVPFRLLRSAPLCL